MDPVPVLTIVYCVYCVFCVIMLPISSMIVAGVCNFTKRLNLMRRNDVGALAGSSQGCLLVLGCLVIVAASERLLHGSAVLLGVSGAGGVFWLAGLGLSLVLAAGLQIWMFRWFLDSTFVEAALAWMLSLLLVGTAAGIVFATLAMLAYPLLEGSIQTLLDPLRLRFAPGGGQ